MHVLCFLINDTETLTKEDTLILGCMKFHKHDLNLKLQYGLMQLSSLPFIRILT